MKRRNRYWTRERCVEAGARFWVEHGIAPTNEDWWHEQTQFTATTATGLTRSWAQRPYPSAVTLKMYWRGMRAYWDAVQAAHPELDILIDAADMPWSKIEEWFIVESVGILPRPEVSELLGRSEPAIKRRLYEMGINSFNRWGWTVTHFARVTDVSQATIMRYVNTGKMPAFRGHKCIYIEPADFLVVQEYNWAKKRHPKELVDAVRASLAQRLCYVLLRFDWRRYSYHKAEVRRETYTGRIQKPREINTPAEPMPKHVKVGDWVIITGEASKYYGARGRIGQAKAICWSPVHRARTAKNPERPPSWVVTVEFPKRLTPGGHAMKRTRINVQASCVQRVRKPYERTKPKKPQRPRLSRKQAMKEKGTRALGTRLKLQPDIHGGAANEN